MGYCLYVQTANLFIRLARHINISIVHFYIKVASDPQILVQCWKYLIYFFRTENISLVASYNKQKFKQSYINLQVSLYQILTLSPDIN